MNKIKCIEGNKIICCESDKNLSNNDQVSILEETINELTTDGLMKDNFMEKLRKDKEVFMNEALKLDSESCCLIEQHKKTIEDMKCETECLQKKTKEDPPYLPNNSEICIHKPQTNTKISKIKRNEITENKNEQKVTDENILTVEKITTEDPTVAAVISLPEPIQPMTNTDIISLIDETDVNCHPETAQYAGETRTQDDLGARAEGPEESSHPLQAIHGTTECLRKNGKRDLLPVSY
ncbi:hypothetical protein JTB14_008942 [Gonioctena quinquepunctata]|nr:hypothetical protein JTB14_008942 [Gonioctena quinquepunctata]